MPCLPRRILESNFIRSSGIDKIRELDIQTVAFLIYLFPECRPDRKWKINNRSDFISYIERVIAIIDYELRSGLGRTLDELNDIINRVTTLSLFLSINLKKSVKRKFSRSAYGNNLFLENYGPAYVPEALAIRLLEKPFEPQIRIITAQLIYKKARNIKHYYYKYRAYIKIFSKSGKDSTSNRIGIYRILRDNLKLNISSYKIKERYILKGELLKGFILKVYNDFYFSFDQNKAFIKLKKDYILGLSNITDLIIEDIRLFSSKLILCIIDIIDKYGISRDDILFSNLFTIKVIGTGFNKSANIRYFILRFPRILKIYNNCPFKDIVSFKEL
ncbi:hypothetical protein QBC40DRAFT_302687 [Triangularia verruculosa]|uniref:Uncharacterized protein n=1 Tax=Triangularia verruculosa TaxID=2587418 RepID=A0AAN6XRP7_9PEZI|nr:hypothetical protein QBC40DRAFT_302687 [Triangularia verruculosa]